MRRAMRLSGLGLLSRNKAQIDYSSTDASVTRGDMDEGRC